LGAALASDLGAYRSERTVLYIDEFDRVPHVKDYGALVTALVANLPSHVQLAFSSRLLTFQPWYDLVSKGVAVVLGTEYHKNDIMFTVEDEPKPQLEVYAFGRGHAIANGQEITNWDGALPRNLFFFFIHYPLVTRDQIFAEFWPNLSVKEATNVFHVTKRKITERITMKVEELGNYELTQYSTGFYMPSDKIIRHYDVANFQEAVEQSMVAENEAEEEKLLRRAIELYKGPFLQTINMNWVLDKREELEGLYVQALHSLGKLYERRGDQNRALGYFLRTLKEAPTREDIHRDAILAYHRLGRPDDAKRQYDILAKTLKEHFGIEPEQASRDALNMS
jgi:two-component SAPR family response regulator